MSKAVIKELQKRLAEAERRAAAPKFSIEEFCFDKQIEFIRDPAKFKTAVCSRRCLAKGTLIQTIGGPKPIEDIKIGDFVFDEFGKPIKVKAVYNNGENEVIEVLHNRRIMFEATENHVMLTYHSRAGGIKERSLSEFYHGVKIVRTEIDRNNGAHVKYAYALGALLGDGCGTEDGKSYIVISSRDEKIPSKVGELLHASETVKMHHSNFSYKIRASNLPEEYLLWCSGKKAHEKICDIQRILSWDRPSRLAFIAGLIDTDGSVINQDDGIQIRLSMQAKSVIDAIRLLFLDLWNYEPSIYVDNRDKYKNGPVYNLSLKHNYFAKKVLKDLDPYLLSEHKKYKSEYENKLENNYNNQYVGVTFGNKRVTQTYDIHVESATNLYCLANGLVTHNSGKTVSCAADLIDTALTQDGDVAYITLTRGTAKGIIWRDLLRINEEYELGGEANIAELTLTLPNRNIIYLFGANDESQIDKIRGRALRKVYIDEAQSFRPYIKEFINDVIEPALTDYDGTLILIGTPGPVPAGYFFDASHSEGWSNHKWTIHDNPHILKKSGKTPEQRIEAICKRRGVTLTDPSIRREYFGEWVQDFDSLVFKFEPSRNEYLDAPADLKYVFGIDVGFRDSDAIAVVGYDDKRGLSYLVEEYVAAKQDITSLAEKIKELQAKYEPVRMIMDAGALGRKIQEEIRQRHQLPVEAAEKSRKLEFIKLLNDDLRTGAFKAKPGSRFAEDSQLVVWDWEDPSKPKISDRYHSDITDAVLYAWRECKHYFKLGEVIKHSKTSDAYMDELEAKEADAMEAKKLGHDTDWGVDQDDLNSLFGEEGGDDDWGA